MALLCSFLVGGRCCELSVSRTIFLFFSSSVHCHFLWGKHSVFWVNSREECHTKVGPFSSFRSSLCSIGGRNCLASPWSANEFRLFSVSHRATCPVCLWQSYAKRPKTFDKPWRQLWMKQKKPQMVGCGARYEVLLLAPFCFTVRLPTLKHTVRSSWTVCVLLFCRGRHFLSLRDIAWQIL